MAARTDKEFDHLGGESAEAASEFKRQVHAAQRLVRLRKAHDSLLDYTKLSMPDPRDPDNPDASRYKDHIHHRYIAKELEAVERGEVTRLIINLGPRHGKSELVSKRFPTWFVGRDPYRQVIVSSYGDDLATDFGRAGREIILSPFYQQVFPGTTLKRGSRAVDRLETTEGGVLVYRGVGSALTGYGADLGILDDPLKGRGEANSRTVRDNQWGWFLDVFMTRLMGEMARVVIVMTRWHQDDIVGRLTDPKNPYYDEATARQWRVVNIPAIIETDKDERDDPFGRSKGEVLWPERIPKSFLLSQRRVNPSGFNALYQGRPSPPEGNFFKREHIKSYKAHQLPRNLRLYAASDHAVSMRQDRDPTCMGAVGVDEDNNVYILPDLVWRQIPTDVAVEAMLDLMRRHRPLLWWAEKGHISQSIGPFLRQRMLEEETYVTIDEKTPVKDKQTRAQAIQARMTMGKVFLPEFAPWYEDAVDELLNFPHGSHDDFVDFIAWIGIGLSQIVGAERTLPDKRKEPKVGSVQWVMANSAYHHRPKRSYLN